VKNKDFSPLLPLSWKSLIYLQIFSRHYEKLEENRQVIFEDIRYFAAQEYLANCHNPQVALTFIPSNILRQTRDVEERMANGNWPSNGK